MDEPDYIEIRNYAGKVILSQYVLSGGPEEQKDAQDLVDITRVVREAHRE